MARVKTYIVSLSTKIFKEILKNLLTNSLKYVIIYTQRESRTHKNGEKERKIWQTRK
jgi:hypothetical protein